MNKERVPPFLLHAMVICILFSSSVPISIEGQGDTTQVVELELNKPLEGVISKAGLSNWYRFNVSVDSSYVIEILNQSLTMNAFFTLYTADESILTWSYSKITYNFTEAGTYLVQVKHSDSKYGVGTYTILRRKAQPPKIFLSVFDNYDAQPIKNAKVKVYTPVSYTLIGENTTTEEGETTIQLRSRGYYLITVSADGYDDTYGVTTLSDEGENIRFATLGRTEYTGLVLSSALVRDVVAPSDSNTIDISFYNMNSSYPITLTNITVLLPWYGFYNGQIQGIIVVTEDMPITIPANTVWITSIEFTSPPDVTAYGGSYSALSHVDFNAQAQAWRTSYEVIEDVGLREKKALVTVNIIPERQDYQGFRALLEGFALVPITDPKALDKLDEAAIGIKDISFQMDEVENTLAEVTFRIGEVNTELATVSSRLKTITTNLDETNLKIDDVTSKLSSSDNKLSNIVSELVITNDNLKDVTTQLESVDREITTLSSQQQETNSKLDTIDNQLATTRDYADNIINELFGDLRTMLLVLIGVVIVIAAVNIIYLIKNIRQISK